MSEGIHVWFFCRVAEKYGYGMVWYGMVWRGVAWYGSSTVPILIKCIGLTMKSIHRSSYEGTGSRPFSKFAPV